MRSAAENIKNQDSFLFMNMASNKMTKEELYACKLGLDDDVTINGITGYVDFIGAEIVAVAVNTQQWVKFKYEDIGRSKYIMYARLTICADSR